MNLGVVKRSRASPYIARVEDSNKTKICINYLNFKSVSTKRVAVQRFLKNPYYLTISGMKKLFI